MWWTADQTWFKICFHQRLENSPCPPSSCSAQLVPDLWVFDWSGKVKTEGSLDMEDQLPYIQPVDCTFNAISHSLKVQRIFMCILGKPMLWFQGGMDGGHMCEWEKYFNQNNLCTRTWMGVWFGVFLKQVWSYQNLKSQFLLIFFKICAGIIVC